MTLTKPWVGDAPEHAHAPATIHRGIDQSSPTSLATQIIIPSLHIPQIYLLSEPASCLLHSLQGQVLRPPCLIHLLLDLPPSQPFLEQHSCSSAAEQSQEGMEVSPGWIQDLPQSLLGHDLCLLSPAADTWLSHLLLRGLMNADCARLLCSIRAALTKPRNGLCRVWTLKGSGCWSSTEGQAAELCAQLTHLGGFPRQECPQGCVPQPVAVAVPGCTQS